MTRLACTEVYAGYGVRSGVLSDRMILHGISLAVESGELAVVIGPNGGGKTTLMRALSGALRPHAGSVDIDGVELARLNAREKARRVAVVSQRVAPIADVSVADVVLMGRYAHLAWHTGYRRSDKAAAAEAMICTGVGHLAGRQADTLSGGEWQRVLLARALAQEADALLLDEPAAGLDPSRLLELFDLLEARRARGAAVLAVLHDINVAALYATRLIGLRDGQICFDGPPHDVFTSQRLSVLYGIPISIFLHPVTGAPQACLVPAHASAGGNHRDARHVSSPAGTGVGTD